MYGKQLVQCNDLVKKESFANSYGEKYDFFLEK